MVTKFVFVVMAIFFFVQDCSGGIVERSALGDFGAAMGNFSVDGISKLRQGLQLDKLESNIKDIGETVQTGTMDLAASVSQKALNLFKRD